MILRVLTARVPSGNIGEFNELLRAHLKELHGQPGLVYAKLARRLANDQAEEVVIVEEWSTTADLFGWTQGRLTSPRLPSGAESLVDDVVITHYEALDVSPDDLQRRVLGIDPAAAIEAARPMDPDASQPTAGDEPGQPRATGSETASERLRT